MMNIFFKYFSTLFLLICSVFLSEDALACSVCFGDPQSTLTTGLHMGVLTLLVVVVLVLAGFAMFFLHLKKLGRKYAQTSTL